MPLTPYDWNVVVIGGWNPAILTPHGVITRLFQLPENSETGLYVPLYAVAPLRISHRGIAVQVDATQLMVIAEEKTYECLQRALALAHRALQILPETPVTVAGYNVRYADEGHDERLAPLDTVFRHDLDGRLDSAGYTVVESAMERRVKWDIGIITLELTREATGLRQIRFNFECKGSHDQLMAWLDKPVDGIRAHVESLFTNALSLDRELLR